MQSFYTNELITVCQLFWCVQNGGYANPKNESQRPLNDHHIDQISKMRVQGASSARSSIMSSRTPEMDDL